MNTSRRSFLGGLAATAVGATFAELPKTEPIMRLGVMTDTHVGKTVESCARVRMALELFRDKGVELVVNNGDIADHHYPTGYRAYRQVFNEVYAGVAKPREIYAYAWHDAFDYQGHGRSSVTADAPAAFEDVRRLLEAPNGHTAEMRFKGYAFLVMPQFTGAKGFLSWAEYEERIAAACKANPGKPVFVVDHIPPQETVYDSIVWGNRRTRQIMDKYPQVVDLSGHVHGSLRNDVFIWQGNFTVINSGCLFGWGGLLAGTRLGYDKQEYGVLTIDVHEDRLLVRRWDVRDRTEIDAAHPWVVPLPFVAATAPYLRWKRRAAEPKPAFAAAAKVAATAQMKAGVFAGLKVEFPDSAKGAMTYRVSAVRKTAGGTGECAMCELYSEYTKRPQDRRPRLQYVMPAAYFAPATAYRIAVTPVNQYGDAGEAIVTETTTPAAFAPTTVTWTCVDPMRTLRFVPLAHGAKPYEVGADGFCGPLAGGTARLELPPDAFVGEAGTRCRLTVDVWTKCPGTDQQPTIRLVPKGGAGRAVDEFNGFGDVRSLRFFEITLDGKTAYDLDLWGAQGGKVRFGSVKLERIGTDH